MNAKLILAAAALLLSGELAAQTFKCTNAAGKITYSGTSCKELGLKDAGEVKDRLNVNPAYKPPPAATKAPVPSKPGVQSAPPSADAPAAAESANPDRRCFTIQIAKGKVVTRCNDRSDE